MVQIISPFLFMGDGCFRFQLFTFQGDIFDISTPPRMPNVLLNM